MMADTPTPTSPVRVFVQGFTASDVDYWVGKIIELAESKGCAVRRANASTFMIDPPPGAGS